MGVVFKQAVAAASAVSATTVTVNITPVSSSSILVAGCGGNLNGGVTISSVADGINGTWTNAVAAVVDGSSHFTLAAIYYVLNTTTSTTTITVTYSAAAIGDISVMEFTSQSASPIGNNSTGSLITGTGADINSSGSISASAGDAIVVFGDHYYSPTWAVGATNPSGMAIPSGATATSGSTNNVTGAYVILGSSYNGGVGLNPGGSTTDYGVVAGLQIVAAAGAVAAPHIGVYQSFVQLI